MPTSTSGALGALWRRRHARRSPRPSWPLREMIEGAMTAARQDSRTGDFRAAARLRKESASTTSAGLGLPGPGVHDSASARILLIDDEPQISGFVARALEHRGYRVDIAADAAEGVRLASSAGLAAYDLVILDLIMPDMDGRAVLAEILRSHPAQAVLILSCTADPVTKAECLDLGAQDYLTKPFSLAELTARVRAMQIGELVLDAGRLVADSGTGPVALTRLEFLCLRALMEHGGDPVAKSELLACVWGIDFDPGSNIVDVCIRRLRAKLGFALIQTVRGEGYRLAS
jgi:two-component system OmpR family response regulator